MLHCDEAVYVNNMVYVECLLSLWGSGTLVHASPRPAPSKKPLGTGSLMSFPDWQHLTCVVAISFWRDKWLPQDSTGKERWDAGAWFPLDHTLLPCAHTAPLAEIHFSHEYEYTLQGNQRTCGWSGHSEQTSQ